MPKSPDVTWHAGRITRDDRPTRGATVWLTGLPASGKSTLAHALEERLLRSGRPAYVLDGDNLRHGLNGDLGFSEADRAENVRRTAHVARLMADAGVVAIVSLVSPYASERARARQLHVDEGLPFYEVWVNTPVEVCEERDPKGLYARARAGEIRDMTGVDAPYEAPAKPDLVVSHNQSLDDALGRICGILS